jgi:GT2 family glycosyltransferase
MATRSEPIPQENAGRQESGVPRVLAVLVTHNGRAWLRESLVALNSQAYSDMDVLVIDDASKDSRAKPTLRRIAKRHLRKRRWGYVRTPRPLGFGGAINWALSRVRTDVDLLLFIHDDAVLEPGSLEVMIERIGSDESTAIVGPKIVSWDDATRLEEIGMAIDSFGYPYKGLEEGEIDLGQHDRATEVFFVTSTCMLVRHDVFRRLRGWDPRLRAFAEDLDLCWRARISGFDVRVEPRAKARHLMALATGQRVSPFRPTRYFIRRNRLRAIAKNASGPRLVALIPLYVLLYVMEMLGFAILRQPREILNLSRAFGWNFIALPQTLSERARVQRTRRISDRRLRRLNVRETTRLRSYVSHQADRLEEAWGRRAEVLARRTKEAQLVGARLKGVPMVLILIAVIFLILGFRNILFAPPASVGELLPYPDRATALLRTFVSPWRAVGLGQPSPPVPAFALLGIFPIVTLGAVGIAQKFLVLALGVIAMLGVVWLVSDLVDRPARFVAGAAYGFGAVGYAGTRSGDLTGLVFGAAAPFVLASMIRLIGWVRPPRWNRGREIARVALASAVSAAFVPGSLIVYALIAVVLSLSRVVVSRADKPLRGLSASIVGLIVGWALLLPWSATWFDAGGPFARLLDPLTGAVHAEAFSGHGVLSVVLAQTPEYPPLAGIALTVLGIIAILTSIGQRRRTAIAFWGVIVLCGWLITAMGGGLIPPIVATPLEAAIPASVGFAGLVGLAVSAFRVDLPRRGLGLIHALTLGGTALAAFLYVVGIGPALLAGDWDPGASTSRIRSEPIAQVREVLELEAELEGHFRALWVGEGWSSPQPSVARPGHRYMVTGPRGQVLSDLFENRIGAADATFARVVSSVEEGSTDRSGVLLGAFNIRFVLLERGRGVGRWLGQRDLALVRLEDDYVVLENENWLPRGAVYDRLPPSLAAVSSADPAATVGADGAELVEAEQRTSSRYVAEDVSGPGVVVIAEARHPDWDATVESEQLEPVGAGWANGFDIPGDLSGRLQVAFRRNPIDLLWLVLVGLAWIVVGGAALSRRAWREEARRVAA